MSGASGPAGTPERPGGRGERLARQVERPGGRGERLAGQVEGRPAPAARVVALGLAPAGGASIQVADVLRVDTRGVLGDRYREGRGHWSHDRTSPLTLIATGDVAAVAAELRTPIDPLALRRNVVIEAGTLAPLVGRTFRLGALVLEGERTCEPCRYLEGQLGLEGLKAALRGRGGLRARVLRGGSLHLGDRLVCQAEGAGKADLLHM